MSISLFMALFLFFWEIKPYSEFFPLTFYYIYGIYIIYVEYIPFSFFHQETLVAPARLPRFHLFLAASYRSLGFFFVS
jgi:hypothetical protein